MNDPISIVIGFIIASLLIPIVRKLLPNKVYSFWRISLVIAALIYVVFALLGNSYDFLPLELSGVALYSIFAWLSKKYTMLWLALGWTFHMAWDVFLHSPATTPFVPLGYAPACVGFDLAIAGYLGWLWWNQKT